MTKSSLELGNAFLVLRLFINKKMKASGRNNNNYFVLKLKKLLSK
jgi:hypothetical protein